MEAINRQTWKQRWLSYKRTPGSFIVLILVLLSAVFTLGILFVLITYILIKGIPNLNLSLFALEYNTDNVSMLPALINTLTMTLLSLLIAVPLGIFSAIYMVEYARRGNRIVKIVRMTAETLAGIPSIVYGLFGYLMFVMFLKMRYSMLAGALTLSMMVLPTIMRTTEEALKSVPDSYREGSFGLGAGKLRTVFRIVLPPAMPGILSGVILSIGRMVGETAALMFTAGTSPKVATNLMDSGRTMAVHMYCLMSEGFYIDQAYATAVVLLLLVISLNLISNRVARRFGARS